ncbi:hypothetical protein [Bacillus sp. JCM 19041]|uniref:hypothetical protein n=1 Tax=Bacillus sp. JCM 19041 TaxID=1460637 RepID=UPI0006D1620B
MVDNYSQQSNFIYKERLNANFTFLLKRVGPTVPKTSFFVDIHARLRTIENPEALTKIGFWHEGATSWIGDSSWKVNAAFSKTASSVISQAYHKQWNLNMTILDRQTEDQLGSVRHITLKNESDHSRHIKLLLHQMPIAQREGVVFYSPQEKALIHHSQDSYSLFSVQMPCAQHIQHGAGPLKQNWSDQEGKLFFAPFSATSMESVIAASVTIEPRETYKARASLLTAESLSYLKHSHKKLWPLPF